MKVGGAGAFAEEDHDFRFISAQLKPFETCVVIECNQLELHSFNRV